MAAHFASTSTRRCFSNEVSPPKKLMPSLSWWESPIFDERERAALDFAEAIYRSHTDVEDHQLDALRRHFNDDAIVELTGLIAFQNMWSMFNSALDIPPKVFCPLTIMVKRRAEEAPSTRLPRTER